ncbi:tRNA 2-selenouridine(34) synthase MnmH [Actibacterium sp. 188UL27-1]|uniref:tRNA 2-selenouridine(34) synthase MnmH n=1 Tax=Actibacterium sp. 188UL27-1 TaxID=2786961 RepID=UPI00195E7AD0|nr:tRNA 2-selenouridine(34) synthase MnmH [Actibacterium sp. 188UL27-1]MBM7069458.1 tRNA 2-selenouridine(34) synthase MnmH [Actibacterium sp. 188UL27-1]
MAYTLPDLTTLAALPFDTVIDVRSPSEYAEDHLPGAINLPVLTDAQRAEVGTIYVQDSPFRARKIGAALVAKNAACHLETALADKDGGWQPLVYCWRGGQRSGSFGSILSQIGWRVEVLEGGYQTYRRAVVDCLYKADLPHRVVLVDGHTGTAKTEILHRIKALGGQVLDLEGLANHRGSVLGPRPDGQPAQKGFESAIIAEMSGIDPALPVFVEAESSKVGARLVPPTLWSAMRAAPRIRLVASPAQRAGYLARAYRDLVAKPDDLKLLLGKLLPYVGRERLAAWMDLVDAQEFTTLAHDLIVRHYDARYAKSGSGHDPVAEIKVTFDPAGIDRAATRIMGLADTL